MPNQLFQQAVTRVEVVLNAHDCPTCGVIYGLPEDLERRRREDGLPWYCPNGHEVHYTKSEVNKLKEQLEAAESKRQALERNLGFYTAAYDQSQAEVREYRKQVRGQKAAKTRLMRRITNGVCPCCQRSFADVQRHMQSRHPGQVVSAAAATARD